MKQRENDNLKSDAKLHSLCAECGEKTSLTDNITYKHFFCSAICKKLFLSHSLSTNRLKTDKIRLNKKSLNKKEHLQTYFAKRLKKIAYLCCSIFVLIFTYNLITSHFAISSINPKTGSVKTDQNQIRQAIIKRIKVQPVTRFYSSDKTSSIQNNKLKKDAIKRTKTVSVKKTKVVNISRVWNAGKNISITFDGGANASSAKQILKILKRNKIKTTFFLSGLFISRYRDITKKIVEDGHEVGNHTFTHPHLTTFSINRKHRLKPGVTYNNLKKELDKTARLFKEITGRQMSPLWRAPYGEINGVILEWASKAGYQHIAWTYNQKTRKSMDSLDWVSDPSSPLYHSAEEIKKRLTSFIDDHNSANGGIVLMHLGTDRKQDIVHEQLDEIISNFIAKGYEFVPVSQLINLKNQT